LMARGWRTVRAIDGGKQRIVMGQEPRVARRERPGIGLDVARGARAAVCSELRKEPIGRPGVETTGRSAFQHTERVQAQRRPQLGALRSRGDVHAHCRETREQCDLQILVRTQACERGESI